jgi:hypothetical protein
MKTAHPSPAKARARSTTKRTTGKAASATRSIFETLKKDHKLFRKAMERIHNLSPKNPENAKAAFAEFKIELHAHSEAEEATLYASLFEKTSVGEKLDDQVREGTEEHHLGDLLMNELSQIHAADPKWKAKFRVLQESVEHHLEEEEENFKLWMRNLSPTESELIQKRFLDRRAAFVAQAISVRH